jgi:hypothetical protein
MHESLFQLSKIGSSFLIAARGIWQTKLITVRDRAKKSLVKKVRSRDSSLRQVCRKHDERWGEEDDHYDTRDEFERQI